MGGWSRENASEVVTELVDRTHGYGLVSVMAVSAAGQVLFSATNAEGSGKIARWNIVRELALEAAKNRVDTRQSLPGPDEVQPQIIGEAVMPQGVGVVVLHLATELPVGAVALAGVDPPTAYAIVRGVILTHGFNVLPPAARPGEELDEQV